MNAALHGAVKSFEVYRRDKGRTGYSRLLSHDPGTGRSWLTEIHEKAGANGDVLRVETTTDLDELDPDERALYELRLSKELAAARAAMPLV
ncbi:hypothetical protein PPSIR1_18055 [Plesiocystis pacifica SIR-1]|uniref:Uncharacterized protein n=1 Tax=Plesiocystis pacifica SIR-1 TaxID=391625 RepID=A6GFV1_9BACT|nr:hypothetical protein [Plesiocystis pacifica]EDM75249.1 hypothetical protein PPSIR1_18055 [Plesiocystis pacifica SIR-1]